MVGSDSDRSPTPLESTVPPSGSPHLPRESVKGATRFTPTLRVPMTSSPSIAWMPTTRAATALGCSPEHLKRQRDSHGGFLEAGHHYALGSSATATITWNVEAVREAFHRRGLKMRAAQNRPSSGEQKRTLTRAIPSLLNSNHPSHSAMQTIARSPTIHAESNSGMQLARDRIMRERNLPLNNQFTMHLTSTMSTNLALKALQLGCSTSELARTLIATGAQQNGLGDLESLI